MKAPPANSADPRCPYFGACGGCSLQNVSYSAQVEEKALGLRRSIGDVPLKVIVGPEFGYRNRLDLTFHPEGLGFRKKGKWHTIVNVERCEIATPEVNSLITEAREFFQGADMFDLRKKTGSFRYAVLRGTKTDSAASIVLNKDSAELEEAKEKVRLFAQKTSAKNVLITYVGSQSGVSISEEFDVVLGRESMHETILGRTLRFSIQGFFQTNSVMAEKMHEYTRELITAEGRPDVLLDLYGGVGAFAVVNANLFKKVVTVENFQGCTDSAKENAAINNLSNIEAFCLDAKDIGSLQLAKGSLAIVDPPRAGMHPKAAKAIVELAPKRLIFISCNPKILGEQLALLSGYKIKSAALFDFFPQTEHAEAVLEMEPV